MISYSVLAGLLILNALLIAYGWRRYRCAMAGMASVGTASEPALPARDPLTGLLNRADLTQWLDRPGQQPGGGAMIVDLDGFKALNQLNGHLAGDSLLRAVADIIRDCMPAGTTVARIGGDAFALGFAAGGAAIEGAARAIAQRLASPAERAAVGAHVSASIGLAIRDAGDSGEALLRRADIAMRAARLAGRGRIAWFDDSMQRELSQRIEIEAGLRAAIPAGEIVPWFEPQVELATGALRGFEMLARWERPGRGVAMPNDFIPVAEEAGLIGDLSLCVMRQAMAEARGWDNDLILSVNLSPIQIADPWLAQKIAKLLSETGFPAERLEVEITEAALFENLGLAQAIVTSFKNQGMRLVLDDFGTGYSSLAHLRALPFDRVKIDRSFVASLEQDPESAVMVSAITRLAESLNLSITAEGIESEAIAARLSTIGSYTGQGWLFGKPMRADDVRAGLADKGLLPTMRDAPPVPTRARRAG